jgi:uncharacterized membrane protein
MFAGWFQDDFGYRFLFLLHIVMVVIGFGSSFVYPAMARRARKRAAAEGHAITELSLQVGRELTTGPIYLAGLTGIVLVAVSEQWKFSQSWVSIAFVLFFVGVGISAFVHTPNLKKMEALQASLLAGSAGATSSGGAPPEVAELETRGKRAGMTGGILHLIFLLLVIDMIWKPGL